MKHYGLWVLALAMLGASPVMAAEKEEGKTIIHCDLQESVFVSIGFSAYARSSIEGKKKFEEKVLQISDLAKETGITKIWQQKWDYTISTQMINYDNDVQELGFLVNATGNYQVGTVEEACKLADLLLKHKFQATITASRFQKPGCSGPFNS